MLATIHRRKDSPQTMVLLTAPRESTTISCLFTRLGWKVYTTQSNSEARRLTRTLKPSVVVLDTTVLEESGWLTCAKMHFQHPQQAIVLLADYANDTDRDYAEFAGAQLLFDRANGVDLLVSTIEQKIESMMECVV